MLVTLKPGVLDAQGQAVLAGLHALGYRNVLRVRVGRYLELAVPDHISRRDLQAMCARFLANPLIERWRIEVGPARPRRSALFGGGHRR